MIGESEPQVTIAPGPDGGVWVVTQERERSLVALLGPDLAPRSGWPVAFDGWTCTTHLAPGWDPVPLVGGGVRVICQQADFDVDPAQYAIAAVELNAAGVVTAIWMARAEARGDYVPQLIGDRLMVVHWVWRDGPMDLWLEYGGDGVNTESGTVVRTGYVIDIELDADGRAYVLEEGGRVTALALSGVVPGWPVDTTGLRSKLAINPTGGIVLTTSPEAGGRVQPIAIGTNGAARNLGQALTVEPVLARDGLTVEDGAIAPLVGADGRITVIGEVGSGIVAHRLDENGTKVAGWPLPIAGSVGWRGTCAFAQGDGCGVERALPVLGFDGTLFVPLTPASPEAGGRIIAIGPNGQVRAGWPKVIGGPGSYVWTMTEGAEGVLFAIVATIERDASRVEVLAIARDGVIGSRAVIGRSGG